MPNYICATCGIQYAASDHYPVDICKICADDRQYVKASGQQWTTLDELTHGSLIFGGETQILAKTCKNGRDIACFSQTA